jgi:hypothetical protein
LAFGASYGFTGDTDASYPSLSRKRNVHDGYSSCGATVAAITPGTVRVTFAPDGSARRTSTRPGEGDHPEDFEQKLENSIGDNGTSEHQTAGIDSILEAQNWYRDSRQ